MVRERFGTYSILRNEVNCAVLKVNGFAFVAAGYIPVFTLTGFNGSHMAQEWQSQNSTLITPSGAQFVVMGNCTQKKWIVETDQIGEWGPPEWVLQLDGSECDLRSLNTIFRYQCHREFQSVPAEAGIYQLHQPGMTLHFEVLAGDNDLIRPRKHPLIGPHVVKQDHKERVMLTPIRSLKEVRLDLTGLNMSQAVPECAPYVTSSHEGWQKWLDLWYGKQLAKSRQTRGLDTILGASGLATGVLDAMSVEVLANKIRYATSDVRKMGTPIVSSLAQLGAGQKLIASILPFWQSSEHGDEEAIVEGLASLQVNSALALACTQAQDLSQQVVMQIIREGLTGNLPLEIKYLLWNNVTQEERWFLEWWQLLSFTYDPVQAEVVVFVLTVSQNEYYDVFPIVPLGIQVTGGLVMYAIDHHSWAYQKGSSWETISLDGCVQHGSLGFICEDRNFQQRDECFYEADNGTHKCSFEILSETGSSVVYAGKGCICIRSHCPLVQVDDLKLFYISTQINRCFCQVASVKGCDFEYHVPHWTVELMKYRPQLFEQIKPITLGMDIDMLRKVISHPELQEQLSGLRKLGEKTSFTVQHNNQKVLQISKDIEDLGGASWWSSFFFYNLSPTAAGVLKLITHPITVILIIQAILLILTLAVVLWVRAKVHQLQYL